MTNAMSRTTRHMSLTVALLHAATEHLIDITCQKRCKINNVNTTVAQPLLASWVFGHPKKFKSGCPTPKEVNGKQKHKNTMSKMHTL